MTWLGRGPPLWARLEGVNVIRCCLMDLPLAKCPTRRKIEPTYATASRRKCRERLSGERV
jgi:hypothetical protein